MLYRRSSVPACCLIFGLLALAACSMPSIGQAPTAATQSAAEPAAATTAAILSPTAPSPTSVPVALLPTDTPAAATTPLPAATTPPAPAEASPQATLVPAQATPTATSMPAEVTPTAMVAPAGPSPTTPPPPPPAATSTSSPVAPPSAAAGKIFYLDVDGHSIRTIRPDGTGIQDVISIQKRPGEVVENLTGEPTGTYLLFSLYAEGDQAARYFLVQNGRAKPIMAFTSRPRWSPDGRRFVAATAGSSQMFGPIYLYDTVTGAGRMLPARGVPDWFPDGRRLVYAADNIFTFDLATNASTQLTRLPAEGNETWGVQEAHVFPSGKDILFFAGQRKNVGASGNGQQWWSIPVTGGTPAPFSDPGGNGILAFAASPDGGSFGYVESAHASACLSAQQVTITGASVGGGAAMNAPVPASIPESETASFFIQGMTWAPDSAHIAYGVQPYRCPTAGDRPRLDQPAVYTWSIRMANGSRTDAPRKLVDGSYPEWIR